MTIWWCKPWFGFTQSGWEQSCLAWSGLALREFKTSCTGLFEMIVEVLITCCTQYTSDRSVCIFLFNGTTLQVFVTYLTGALYVHPLWFYKHQQDNRVCSKLFVACQQWWFQWRFWFIPSVPRYLREEEEHKPDPWHNPIERNHVGLHLENKVAVVKTPTIISNNPVFKPQIYGKSLILHSSRYSLFYFKDGWVKLDSVINVIIKLEIV